MIYPLYKSANGGREWLGSLYSDESQKDFGFVLKESGKLIGSGGTTISGVDLRPRR